MAIRYHKVNKILNYQSDVSGYTKNKSYRIDKIVSTNDQTEHKPKKHKRGKRQKQ
jgi:phage FluMu protein Com